MASKEKLLPRHHKATIDARMSGRNDPTKTMSRLSPTSPTSTKVFQNEKAFYEGDSIIESISVASNLDDISISSGITRSKFNVDGASEINVELASWENSEDDDNKNDINAGKKSSIFGTCSNLVNSIVGAGIIGIPYAIKNSGLIVGVFLLILVAYLTDKSLRVLIEAAKFHPQLYKKNINAFEDFMSYPFGKFGSVFVLLNMFIMAYGAMVAYLLIIKDTVPTILGLAHGVDGGIEREIVLIITSATIMVPLSMQRDIASLAWTSLLSVSADVILVFFVLTFSPIRESVNEVGGVGELLRQDSIKPTLFVGLGILSTAMACQQTSFIVHGSLENPTSKRWSTVTNSSIFTAALLCIVLGVTGYLGFLDDTQGDVLNNFEPGSVAANGARALLAITMLFTYPMEVFVGRHVLISLFYNNANTPREDETTCCPNRGGRMAIFLYVLALIPALIFDDLGPVLSITGSIGGSCISFITPGIAYLGVHGDAFLLQCKEMLDDYNRKRRTQQNEHNGDIELPVAGDAKRVMEDTSNVKGTNNLPSDGTKIEMISTLNQSKPIWWFLLGYPIWCWIATKGIQGMKRKLSAPVIYDETEESVSGEQLNETISEEEILFPTKGGFRMAIFFIIFGVIAAIAGLGSNIYVQITDTDEFGR